MSKSQGTAGRFGARYGNILRKRVSKIESSSRSKHKCPKCFKENKVKREAYGIWRCLSCNHKFVGKAYEPY